MLFAVPPHHTIPAKLAPVAVTFPKTTARLKRGLRVWNKVHHPLLVDDIVDIHFQTVLAARQHWEDIQLKEDKS